ncbi:MAG TPA: hypothetical protein PLZ31_02580 [Myxococcota bacterium]|nr:hypothetical protein [Myxococcota bacterium]
MTSPLSPEKSGIQSFQNDIEYLTAEFEWMRVRARRIEFQRELEEQSGAASKRYNWRGRSIQPPITADMVACLQEQESVLRRGIDARLEMNRGAGPALGLDKACVEFHLNSFERHILLLATLPCFGSNASLQTISRVDPTQSAGSIYLEIVSLFLELPPAEHLQMMQSILPTAPLRTNRLIHLMYDPFTPGDSLGVSIDLTGAALAGITSIAAFRGFAAPAEKGEG